MKQNQQRIDYFEGSGLGESDTWLIEKFVKTEDGFLSGRAIVSNIGVFPYLMPDGSIFKELRLPEEVMSDEALTSLALKPVTDEHPKEWVNSENAKALQKGFLGDRIRNDTLYCSAPIMITDADLVHKIQNEGKRGLSCGYTCDIEPKAGVWCGVQYDRIQRNIRYNHVAVVSKGRAGDAATIRMDVALPEAGIQINQDTKKIKEDSKMSDAILKKFTLDGVEYQAEADVIKHCQKIDSENKELKLKLDTAEKQNTDSISAMQAKLDAALEENKDLKVKVDEAGKLNPETLKKALDEKMVLMGAASIAGVEYNADMDDLTAKKEIVKKLFPGSTDKIDSADAVYVNARFDVALEKLEEMKADKQDNFDTLSKDVHTSKNVDNADKARKDMIAEACNAWNKKQEDK